MANEKDSEQDELIRKNAERIARNEEAILRQTEALEKIRDHYYPRKTLWKRVLTFCAKVSCAIFAYLGIAETVDWIWNAREADALAEKYAKAACRLFAEEGDAASAMKCYEKAVAIDPKESEYIMTLSFMRGMAMDGRFLGAERMLTNEEQASVDAALAEATVMRELQPDNPMPHVLMAQALLISGEQPEAIAAIERAVACEPGNATIHVSACAINFFSGHPTEAREHLTKAEQINAKLPLVNVWKGTLALAIDHDAAKAREFFEAATRKTPRLALAHAMLGRALLSAKNPDIAAARAAFNRAVILNAKLTIAILGVAETYEREGNLSVARLCLERALTVDKNCLPAYVAHARINAAMGDRIAAEADWTRAIALDSFSPKLYLERAKAREQLGNAEGASMDRKMAEALKRQ